MTRDEILNMPAGRDMDALIAEKVFWAKVIERTDSTLIFFDVRARLNGKSFTVYRYSADISAAWAVVERFENRCMLNNVHGIWECYLLGATGKSKSAPLAICRAALLAVMPL